MLELAKSSVAGSYIYFVVESEIKTFSGELKSYCFQVSEIMYLL